MRTSKCYGPGELGWRYRKAGENLRHDQQWYPINTKLQAGNSATHRKWIEGQQQLLAIANVPTLRAPIATGTFTRSVALLPVPCHASSIWIQTNQFQQHEVVVCEPHQSQYQRYLLGLEGGATACATGPPLINAPHLFHVSVALCTAAPILWRDTNRK